MGIFVSGMTTDSYDCIFTSYNSASTILGALDSAATQTIPPNKILIVDDCSSDLTWDLIVSSRDRYSNLVTIRNDTNRGQSYCRNLGVQNSSSDYLVFFDDDDISYSNRAVEHLQMLRSGSDVSYVSSRKIYSNNYSKMAINSAIEQIIFDLPELLELLFYPSMEKNPSSLFFPSSTLAITRKAFTKVLGFDTNLRRLEDLDLALKLAKENMVFSFSNKLLVDRYASTGPDKASSIDSKYELVLITKYGQFMNPHNFRLSIFFAKARGYYFSKDFVRLFSHLGQHLFLLLSSTYRLKNIKNRLIHDFKKRNR